VRKRHGMRQSESGWKQVVAQDLGDMIVGCEDQIKVVQASLSMEQNVMSETHEQVEAEIDSDKKLRWLEFMDHSLPNQIEIVTPCVMVLLITS
jgi:hypothetical protein